MPRSLALACLAIIPVAANAQQRTDELGASLLELQAAHPGLVELSRLGLSRAGRPLHLLTLADAQGPAPADARPALLIVAGINSQHRIGVEVAVGVARRLAADHDEGEVAPPLLRDRTVYIVPGLNPDGLAFALRPPLGDHARTIAPYDADHDGRVNEDGPEDLNGDGLISMMRVRSPRPAGAGAGLVAEWTIDPDDPRLMKKPDPAKGEAPTHALLIEGLDNDGDGRFNEDGPGGSAGGGVDLDMNFPYRWQEHADGAGPYQLSEPESLALVRWMLERPNIAAVLVYGPGDTLVNIPQAGKMDESGRVPVGIENDDKPYFEEISRAFKEITGMTGAPGGGAEGWAGSLPGWSYGAYGVFAFRTPVWVRPDLVKETDEKADAPRPDAPDEPDEPGSVEFPILGVVELTSPGIRAGYEAYLAASADERAQIEAHMRTLPESIQARITAIAEGQDAPAPEQPPPGGRDQPARPPKPDAKDKKKGGDTDDHKWLKYLDENPDAGPGFVDWHPFEHPQLGEVEIGGFVPGFRHNPPAGELPRLTEEQARFATDLLERLPGIAPAETLAEPLGPGVWRVWVRAVNGGYLPSISAMGARARRATPTILSIDLPLERILSGEKVRRHWAIPGSGGSVEAEWIITGETGSAATVLVRPGVGPEHRVDVPLEGGDQ